VQGGGRKKKEVDCEAVKCRVPKKKTGDFHGGWNARPGICPFGAGEGKKRGKDQSLKRKQFSTGREKNEKKRWNEKRWGRMRTRGGDNKERRNGKDTSQRKQGGCVNHGGEEQDFRLVKTWFFCEKREDGQAGRETQK